MIDKSNMVGVLDDFPNQIHTGFFDLAEKIQVKGDFKNIVFAGMGGSAIAGIIIKDYFAALKSIVKITIANSYHIPKGVSKKALVACCTAL